VRKDCKFAAVLSGGASGRAADYSDSLPVNLEVKERRPKEVTESTVAGF
jgi:hypothetical protein